MATSESEDFESADEELGHHITPMRRNMQKQQQQQQQQQRYARTIGSDSDDDTDYISQTVNTNMIYSDRAERTRRTRPAAKVRNETVVSDKETDNEKAATAAVDIPEQSSSDKGLESNKEKSEGTTQETVVGSKTSDEALSARTQDTTRPPEKNTDITEPSASESSVSPTTDDTTSTSTAKGKERVRQQRRPHEQPRLGAKKLGSKLPISTDATADGKSDEDKDLLKGERVDQILAQADNEKLLSNVSTKLVKSSDKDISTAGNDWDDMDLPEELKSDKKFKEVFKPDGWEGLGDDIELPDELTEEKLQPVLERLASAGQEPQMATNSWGGWGSWGVSSLINTATASVSTLTSHVSHGLTLLEETIGGPEPPESPNSEQEEDQSVNEQSSTTSDTSPSQSSFGFSNFLSGVSTITKLVENTGSKVVSGGLDTLEAIGKKTMEVLQEGDPGLKKKRAFLTIETDKPILSKILREAKEKAEAEEKTLEEKQSARKVHFESLFDDYQGLVHLEALEMLSKQSNMKIQQYLINLDTNELTSAQETLDEVKELCDLGDDDDDDNDERQKKEKDLKIKLQEACKDLGVNISYDKVCDVWEEAKAYISSVSTQNHKEVFQQAISMLAKFTALSVERFHKTAELLLVKERRSTVKEADALVQLTCILSGHIGTIANLFCDWLNDTSKSSDKPDVISTNITTVFLEAANASSYIQDAFRLLIPILQVGAI